jgi:zinc protease
MTRLAFPVLAGVLLAGLLATGCGSKRGGNTILLPVADDPTVSFRVCFMVGAQEDPAGKEGLALLTAKLLAEGATTRNSYDRILDSLYPMAAGYDCQVDKEMTVFTGRTHGDNLDAYLTLFLDAILHPAFSPEDFERVRADLLNDIEKSLRYASDEELGKAALEQLAFGGTPYGHLNGGTVRSLRSMTLEDARAFSTAHYTRRTLVIGMGGGYPDAALDRLRAALDSLPEGASGTAPVFTPAMPDGRQVLLVDKPCDATAISFGFPLDVVRGDDDFFALALFNSWFGEHRNSSSHLYQVIRERRGMNYGDYSYIEHFAGGSRLKMPQPNTARHHQLFEVWIRPVQHAHRAFALRAALRELQAVIDSGMREEDFQLTRRFLSKYALLYATTTSERLGMALDSRFYGLDEEYIALFRKRIDALSLDQVNTAIRKHLQTKNVAIAMVTQGAAAFAAELAADTPSPVTYTSPKPESILAEDAIIARYPLGIRADRIRVIPVDQMFER